MNETCINRSHYPIKVITEINSHSFFCQIRLFSLKFPLANKLELMDSSDVLNYCNSLIHPRDCILKIESLKHDSSFHLFKHLKHSTQSQQQEQEKPMAYFWDFPQPLINFWIRVNFDLGPTWDQGNDGGGEEHSVADVLESSGGTILISWQRYGDLDWVRVVVTEQTNILRLVSNSTVTSLSQFLFPFYREN